MLNDWFSETTIEIDWKTFQRLPRHPACRYEYKNGTLHISGNPRFYHAVLDLNRMSGAGQRAGDALVRPLEAHDWQELTEVFVDAFAHCEPFAHLKREARLVAAAALLEETRQSQYGPLVKAASFVHAEPDGTLKGAVLTTLIPAGSLRDFAAPEWSAPVPADAVNERWGQPHLTWIFVAEGKQRRGGATRLLAQSAAALKSLEYSTLASTFLLGDHASTLWHWRMGFELQGYPGKFEG